MTSFWNGLSFPFPPSHLLITPEKWAMQVVWSKEDLSCLVRWRKGGDFKHEGIYLGYVRFDNGLFQEYICGILFGIMSSLCTVRLWDILAAFSSQLCMSKGLLSTEWFQPTWKICSSNWIDRGENKQYLKPPPSLYLSRDNTVDSQPPNIRPF